MASFNAQIRHMSIPELKKESENVYAILYDPDYNSAVKHEAEIRICYLQRELQARG